MALFGLGHTASSGISMLDHPEGANMVWIPLALGSCLPSS